MSANLLLYGPMKTRTQAALATSNKLFLNDNVCAAIRSYCGAITQKHWITHFGHSQTIQSFRSADLEPVLGFLQMGLKER